MVSGAQSIKNSETLNMVKTPLRGKQDTNQISESEEEEKYLVTRRRKAAEGKYGLS